MAQKEAVIALGFFDGVHLGHAALLRRVLERAEEKKAIPAVLTFDIHPDTLVLNTTVPLINSAGGRADIIRRYFGIENIFCLHFDREVMRMPWQEFLDEITRQLRAVHLVVGHDFSFGNRGEGCPALMERYCPQIGVGVDVIPPVMLDGRVVSSTYIRRLLLALSTEELDL